MFLLLLLAFTATLPAGLAAQSPEAIRQALSNLRWREIGPANTGGRVTAIAGVPGDPKTFWVGGADGGLWKTTNAGTTFEPQWQDAEAYSVGAIAVAPSDPNVVWLGSGEGDPRNSTSYGLGVWRSTDGGKTWAHLGLRGTERIKRIAVDPRDPNVALVCALGKEWGPNDERGVFKTTDGGRTWRKVLYLDQDTGCSDIDIELSNPRNIYAGMWTFRRRPWRFDDGGKQTALYISRDAGETWKKVETLPKEPMARPGVKIAQSSPNIVYLITEYPTAGTLFRSEDHGETWRMVNNDRNLNFRPFYYSDVFVDPSNADVVYTLSGGLSKSTDGGRKFQRIARDVHGDHQAFWIDPRDGNRLLSGSDGGHQVSYDGGATFHIMRNINLAQFYHIDLDDRDPYWVCGGLQDNGNWCGPSRTRQGMILTDEWYTVSGGDGFYAVPVPGKPWLVYSNAQGGYFRITDTRSGQTRSIEPYPRMIGSQGQNMAQAKYRFNWDAPIHISRHDPSTVYWGANILFKSTDNGYTWQIISPDLTTDDPAKQRDSGGEIYNDNTAAEFHTTILTIAQSPIERGVIWVGTDDGNIQVTRDGGGTWTNVRDNVPGLPREAWIGMIEASPAERGTAFVAVDNHRMDDFKPHVWETRDYGRTWRDLSAGLPQDDYAIVVRQHPRNADLLFVGMDRGIVGSWDRGRTWVDIRNNLPRVSVRGMRIEPRYNDLVIGTHGRGAFILDDVGPLVQLAEAMREDVHLFPIRTATDWESWDRDSNLGQSVYRGENPPDGAYINFWLSSAATAGSSGGADGDAARTAPTAARVAVRIRISDSQGRVVRELQHDASTGVNRVVWNLRWEPAMPIPGDTAPAGRPGGGGEGGGFGGGGGAPRAIPGNYTATLIGGGRELTQRFVVRGDPDVEATAADYDARLATALRARTLQSRINGMIGAVVDIGGQLQTISDSMRGSNTANANQIRTLSQQARERVTALENELRRPPPRMGYRQYPRLSEDAGRLAGAINSVQTRPTAGQLEVLGEVETDAEKKAGELQQLLDTTIAELNRLVGRQRIRTNWSRAAVISLAH
jgi:photosystem II stability/assembly factor-like uncharacterized protein